MKLQHLKILVYMLFLNGCIGEKANINVSFNKKTTPVITKTLSSSVSSVKIINNQLIISGTGFTDISKVLINGNSLEQGFEIESKSNTQIIANSLNAFSFDVSKVFNLILSDAEASATFAIDFSLCNSTLNGIGFNCAITAIDKDVLSYDAVSGKWKPRAATGINYLGAFNASTNPPAPTPTPFPPSGSYYIVSADGMIGTTSFVTGDWLISNGSVWQKIGNSTLVTSVFTRTGNIAAQEGDYSLDLLSDVSLPGTPGTGKVLKFDGTNWVASDDLTGGGAGSVTTTTIADGAITDVKIAAVSASKINGTINSTQILDGTIVNADINAAAAIDYSKINIPNTTIPYAKLNIANGDIPAAKISGLPAVTTVLATSISDADTTHAPDGNSVFDALGLKLNLTGGSLTGGGTISNVPDPVNPDDVSNRTYVDTKLAKAGGTMTGELNIDTELKLKGTSNYVTLKALPATATYTLTLPTNAGTSGDVLSTDGNGVLSWITAATSGGSGTVTSVTGTGAISVTNSTTTPQITVASASTSTTGVLSSTDWNTFNGKQTSTLADGAIFIGNSSAVATAVAVTGDVTISNTGVTSIGANKVVNGNIANTSISPAKLSGTRDSTQYLRGDNTWPVFATDVAAVALGTITPTTTVPLSPVTTGDTITVAFNKTQGQLNNLATKAVTKDGVNFLTGSTAVQGMTARLTVPTPLITDTTDATNVSYVSTAISNAITAATTWTVSSSDVYRSAGKVGIATTTPAVALDVNGTIKSTAVTNSSTTIDFATGNLQYTSAACGTMTLNNMKSGATYTLSVQGAAGGTCAFNAYTGIVTGGLTVKVGPASLVQTANKHTLFTFLVMGTFVYVASIDGY